MDTGYQSRSRVTQACDSCKVRKAKASQLLKRRRSSSADKQSVRVVNLVIGVRHVVKFASSERGDYLLEIIPEGMLCETSSFKTLELRLTS